MITEDYVSFETAKLLKEKGFDRPTRFVWYERLPASIGCDKSKFGKNCMELFYYNSTTQFEQPFINNREIPDYIQGEVYSAPTLQMAMKWLREVHNIAIETQWEHLWYAYIKPMTSKPSEEDYYQCESSKYEEACEAAIKYCLTNKIIL